jgi:uncharacterized RDD family membrane protein YckC
MSAAAGPLRPAGPPLVCAGLLPRLAAMAYELLLLSGVLAVTLILPHILIATFAQRVASAAVLWAHLFLLVLVYFVGFWSHGGQTLAMKTWRIRLVSRDGQAVGPPQALLRCLLGWLTLAPGGIGIFWALADPDRQFLHDRLAGTRLVLV